ncbi:hypothetical protein HOS55_gp004 [Pseudomonas phage PMBT3]|uniref:Uncharacterized protein n=1 Tax=Pseudomonas phage PMBT3 TaxID=2059856 RepID=A0A2I6PHS5_9CAUD|nr:hypothetical protein HOS55_gp004 [Pseudomonas phage PMBT3]AUM59606.1 hypothetical protein [Pseudomonas phage PMBT3]
MADFKFNVLVVLPERLNVITTKLGAAAGENFTDKDIKKIMTMGTVSNFALAADGDEIEGFLDNVDGGPPAGGFRVGGVSRPDTGIRVEAQVAAGAAAVAVKDLVVAGAQLALGTKGLPQVKKGTPATFKYRIMRIISGNGGPGSIVLLERVA